MSNTSFRTTIRPFCRFSRLDSFGRRGELLYEEQLNTETALHTTIRPSSSFLQKGQIGVRKKVLLIVQQFAPSEPVLNEKSGNSVKRTTICPFCMNATLLEGQIVVRRGVTNNRPLFVQLFTPSALFSLD